MRFASTQIEHMRIIFIILFLPKHLYTLFLYLDFFLCIGLIAVPVPPPTTADPVTSVRQLATILLETSSMLLLTHSDFHEDVFPSIHRMLRENKEESSWPDIPMLVIDSGSGGRISTPPRMAEGVKRSEVCFVQYTTGAAGDMKGVSVTHDNILRELQLHTMDVTVGWLPHYYPMVRCRLHFNYNHLVDQREM